MATSLAFETSHNTSRAIIDWFDIDDSTFPTVPTQSYKPFLTPNYIMKEDELKKSDRGVENDKEFSLNSIIECSEESTSEEISEETSEEDSEEDSEETTEDMTDITDYGSNFNSKEIIRLRMDRISEKTIVLGQMCLDKPKILGKGAYGRVFLGQVANNDIIPLAIKLVHEKYFKIKEVMILRKFVRNNSPHIIELFQHKKKNEFHYIGTEYCNGGDLSSLREKHEMKMKEIRSLSRQMAEALNHLSKMNIIHLDVKMTNIFIHYQGIKKNWRNRIYKLGDFGLSVIYEEGMTVKGAGTKTYVAPELITETKHPLKADLFSMGVVLHTSYFAKSPFPSENDVEYVNNIERGLDRDDFENVNIDFTNLLFGLLKFQTIDRIDVKSYLKHPFHDKAVLPVISN